jgi:hypothetical protein
MAQVLAVVDGGACLGHLFVGDTVTSVNSVSVVGKEPQDAQAVFESSCTSLGKVVLHVDRPCKGMMHPLNSANVNLCSQLISLLDSFQNKMAQSRKSRSR